MQLLGFGDLHLKPGGETIDLDKVQVPVGTDTVITNGDVVHRTGPEDIDIGREFFARLDDAGVPIVAIPGNHDPNEYYAALLQDCEYAVNAHEQVVTGEQFSALGPDPLQEHTFVGWGCEQFDFTPEVRLVDFPALDPRTDESSRGRRYNCDTRARQLETALFDHICRDTLSRDTLGDRLGVADRGLLYEQVHQLEATYGTIAGLLERAPKPTILVSHVPPYNTELDRHHSLGTREVDLEGLHVGSIGLKLALREHRPIAALSGHSHNGAYEVGIGEQVRPHMLNLDFRGVVSIDVDGTSETFGYKFHH